jgi:hypothetical protein
MLGATLNMWRGLLGTSYPGYLFRPDLECIVRGPCRSLSDNEPIATEYRVKNSERLLS